MPNYRPKGKGKPKDNSNRQRPGRQSEEEDIPDCQTAACALAETLQDLGIGTQLLKTIERPGQNPLRVYTADIPIGSNYKGQAGDTVNRLRDTLRRRQAAAATNCGPVALYSANEGELGENLEDRIREVNAIYRSETEDGHQHQQESGPRCEHGRQRGAQRDRRVPHGGAARRRPVRNDGCDPHHCGHSPMVPGSLHGLVDQSVRDLQGAQDTIAHLRAEISTVRNDCRQLQREVFQCRRRARGCDSLTTSLETVLRRRIQDVECGSGAGCTEADPPAYDTVVDTETEDSRVGDAGDTEEAYNTADDGDSAVTHSELAKPDPEG